MSITKKINSTIERPAKKTVADCEEKNSPMPCCGSTIAWESIYHDGVKRCWNCEPPAADRFVGGHWWFDGSRWVDPKAEPETVDDCENGTVDAFGIATREIKPIRPGRLAADETGLEWWTCWIDWRGWDRREQVEAW